VFAQEHEGNDIYVINTQEGEAIIVQIVKKNEHSTLIMASAWAKNQEHIKNIASLIKGEYRKKYKKDALLIANEISPMSSDYYYPVYAVNYNTGSAGTVYAGINSGVWRDSLLTYAEWDGLNYTSAAPGEIPNKIRLVSRWSFYGLVLNINTNGIGIQISPGIVEDVEEVINPAYPPMFSLEYNGMIAHGIGMTTRSAVTGTHTWGNTNVQCTVQSGLY
ncbi:MAG: hypothetical protein NUV31_08495, partial [Dehalococcoidales bacterium]|nr:hypothetical protein [Dehalococcoidales bacterium]